MAPQTTLALASLLVFTNVGCAAHDRQVAGGVVATAGVIAVITGLGMAAGCMPNLDDDDPDAPACEKLAAPNPNVGLPVAGLGVGVALVGGVLYGSGLPPPPNPPATPSSTRPSY